MGSTTAFDASRAKLRGPDFFRRFRVPDRGQLLRAARLSGDTDILVVTRGDQSRALTARQMTYHHLAQGELAGHPYLVSF